MTFLGSLVKRGVPGSWDVTGLAHRARQHLWRHRVLLAAICCGLAAVNTVQVLRPAPPPSAPVLVTTRAVAAGARLTGADVALRDVAVGITPPASLRRPESAVGLTAVVPLPRGVALHAGILSDGGVLSSAPPGTVVVPVTLADDGVAALLRPGDRVDLLAPGVAPLTGDSSDRSATYLAKRALVLPAPARRVSRSTASTGLLGGGSDPPPVTLVAVAPSEAPDLSTIAGMGTVSAILVR
ncbi:RcpC/CpaB family pilus assembly protein [Myceligenerans indicum]|uniref:Flagellar biosynthesis protein FlgA n=1 Tax=Myceligenerans indicum TaxID=2593663 RepID=A0ABS1LQG1_9MICO|nr:RcpC/CpaB family pilus assembly protein [Myceligenerans indicum]MBL0888435.1 flagellar biosynthesis protein FlgA [Myceligenerans indicum]